MSTGTKTVSVCTPFMRGVSLPDGDVPRRRDGGVAAASRTQASSQLVIPRIVGVQPGNTVDKLAHAIRSLRISDRMSR
jgi:hypothetical protein